MTSCSKYSLLIVLSPSTRVSFCISQWSAIRFLAVNCDRCKEKNLDSSISSSEGHAMQVANSYK